MDFPKSDFRGFFEILMPGVFLVLNIMATICFLSALLSKFGVSLVKMDEISGNTGITAAILICFGYLVGVILRLRKTEFPDRFSARAIGLIRRKERESDHIAEQFFYPRLMKRKLGNRLPAAAARFYDEFWSDKCRPNGPQNTTFFNFCKTVIASGHPQVAAEVFAAEALSRFVAGSFHALLAAIVLMIINFFLVFATYGWVGTLIPLAMVGEAVPNSVET